MIKTFYLDGNWTVFSVTCFRRYLDVSVFPFFIYVYCFHVIKAGQDLYERQKTQRVYFKFASVSKSNVMR